MLERHLAQTIKQGLGILLVTGLARIVGAQSQAAHAGELLGGDLGILLAVKLLPEILVKSAAIHLGLRHHGDGHQTGCGDDAKGKNGTCKALHVGVSLSTAAMISSLAVSSYGSAPRKFQGTRFVRSRHREPYRQADRHGRNSLAPMAIASASSTGCPKARSSGGGCTSQKLRSMSPNLIGPESQD